MGNLLRGRICKGFEMNTHPDPQFKNVFVDCPICGREEWFIFFRDQFRAVVRCESGEHKDPASEYIVEY